MSKPLHYGMLNPVTGKPFVYGDPNLFYGYYLEKGDPGYVPYPEELEAAKPEPKKKPFHRKARPTDSNTTATPITNTSTTMSTFKFTIIPKAGGGFRTQAVLGEQIDEATLTGAIAAAASITGPQVEIVIKTLFAKLAEAAADNQWSNSLYGTLGMRPTSGGGHTSPDGFQNAAEINADIALTYIAQFIADWQSGLNIENKGTKGLVTPVIATILSEEDGVENHYVAGTMCRAVGTDLRFDKTDPLQGLFIIKPDGSEVRITVYGPINPSEVSFLMPAGITGAVRIRISASIHGSVRSYTYTTPLT